MKILYLGPRGSASTSRHRALALERLGHSVIHLDPAQVMQGHPGRLRTALHYRTGYRFMQAAVMRWLQAAPMPTGAFDVCWVDGGELLGPKALGWLRGKARQIVLFNHDDPSGPRDARRFATLRRAIPQYDLCLVVRPFNVDEFRRLGARDVMWTWRSYDETAHDGRSLPDLAGGPHDNDIVFLGRNMDDEGRDLVIHALIKAGLKVAIWGDNWQRSSVWPELAPHWRGPSLAGRDYVSAIRGARLCLGFLSKGNRDEHTTRSLEIPYAGGVLCAERTPEHETLYRDGVEALFWETASECVEVCRRWLARPQALEALRQAGHRRVLDLQVGNEDLCRKALTRLATGVVPEGSAISGRTGMEWRHG